jgi:hypothetical protein
MIASGRTAHGAQPRIQRACNSASSARAKRLTPSHPRVLVARVRDGLDLDQHPRVD